MLWLYWRRVRHVVIGFGVALAMVTALVLVAVAIGGPDGQATPRSRRLPEALPLRRSAAARADASRVRHGLTLMAAAAAACRSVSYHGVQMVAWSDAAGSDAYLIEVWHRSGQPELAQGDDDVDDHVPGADASSDAAIGVLSISPRVLDLLRANYVIEYAGTGTSSDRPARIVEVRRRDGTLAARYWLDLVTGLPLRREMFGAHGGLVNEGTFIKLEIGSKGVGAVPAVRAPAWLTSPATAEITMLRNRGWTVPGTLAGNLTLIGLTRTATRSGPVVDASYSDGLSVVSVFMQRGVLPGAIRGWQPADVGGLPVYLTQESDLGERGTAWSSDGFVYTVIADAPQGTVNEVIVQLPHDRHVGVWARVGRGLKRIGSWFDPFG